MKSTSRKRGVEGVEASPQLFPSGHGEDPATSSGMPWNPAANLKCEPYHWPRHEANAANLATYDEPEASMEMCFTIMQWLWEQCGVVEDVPVVQRALIIAQDHVISSRARLHLTPSLEDAEVGLCTNEQGGHVVQAIVTPSVVNMAPSKKRKGAQKATSGVKKAKATGKKPRPAEALRTAFRKLIAGLEEVLAMLKEQNVIIANMTKETLKDILSRLLMGLEPPLSLSEVPETKIVEVALRRTFPDRMWSAQESPTNAIFKVGGGSYKQQQWLKETELWPPCGRQLSIQYISELKG
ncbi:TPA: hypothetical protein ACH3X3_006697 [Trebouxia sp. C0006]